ncbi:hypothetical protein [Actinomadura welshii]|uniref:hypothetical protein n=1 Tax=Actinomadura welshii TaxID=3103817 RepID=UPI000467034F|nr:hypothetical protein [Actinomadura madurae]
MTAAAPAAGQAERLRDEMLHLLDRGLKTAPAGTSAAEDLAAEARWWEVERLPDLAASVRRAFAARRLLLAAPDRRTWRDSLSYIGDADPADLTVSEHEYERSDIALRDDHPLAAPYPWAAGRDVGLTVRYTGSGMAAITAWYLALAKLTTDVTVVTNTLYYETETLFELCPAAHVRVEPRADRDGFLRRLRTASGPVVAFLDSCQPFGDAAMVREVLARGDEPGPLAVVWDNACAPIAADPCPGGWTGVPLVLLRSHHKLDELGLELATLGSAAVATPPGMDEPRRAHAEGLRDLLPKVLSVAGGHATAAALRTMDRYGLPDPALTARANAATLAANRAGGRALRAALDGARGCLVQEYEHGCFVNVRLTGLRPRLGNPALDLVIRRAAADAAPEGLAVWRSGSFGFHYTALSGWAVASHDVESLGHGAHTVLRVCFGGHDDDVAAAVARLVARHVRELAPAAGTPA